MFLFRKRMYVRFDDDAQRGASIARRFRYADCEEQGVPSFDGYDVALPPFVARAKEPAARIEEMRLSKGAPVN